MKTAMLRTLVTTAAMVLAFAMTAPAAFAGGPHDGYRHGHRQGHQGYHAPYRSMRHAPRHAYYASPRHVRYANYGYQDNYRGYRSHGYQRHHHWRPGEVIGALVAGAILTDVISDVLEPRTVVVERRVVSGPYYRDSAPPTRYIGSDDGYYERR